MTVPDVASSIVKKFVDDTKLFQVLQSTDDHISIQQDLRLLQWSQKWQLGFKESKSVEFCI